MVDASLCMVSLMLTALYALIFIATVIYLLILNRCKFNKRTKVVICILSMSMLLQMASSSLTYIQQQNNGFCGVYPLAYSLLAQQHIVIMIIYTFLVCRMLSIYYKMKLAIERTPSFKARWARRLHHCQNPIIITYFLIFTTLVWLSHILYVNGQEYKKLNRNEQITIGVLLIPKFLFEMSILVIFICLFKSFNSLSQDY